VLLYQNPLADVRHAREPAGVMLAGRWLDRTELDQRLLAAYPGSRHAQMRSWLEAVLNKKSVRAPGLAGQFGRLTDSLAATEPLGPAGEPTRQRLLRRLEEELGAMRVRLHPERRRIVDSAMRVWLREQARRGYRVAIAGVTPVP
jgi:hypothetical protein